MGTVFLSHTSKDGNFVSLLDDVLTYSGVHTWRSTSGLPPGLEYQREIKAALATADKLLVVVSANAVSSHWVSHECDLFQEMHPDGRVIPVRLDATLPRDIKPSLERFHHIDFSANMTSGFVTLLKVFKKTFLYQDKRAGGRLDRRGGGDRRKPGQVGMRLRIGFWKAFQRHTGYGEFQSLSFNMNTKFKTTAALVEEAMKYKLVAGGTEHNPEEVVREAVDQAWKEWSLQRGPDGGAVAAAYVIEDIAVKIGKAYKVTVIDRRGPGGRRVKGTE